MLLNTIAEKHPNFFALLLPKAVDEQNIIVLKEWVMQSYVALVMSLLFHQMKVQSLSECIIQCWLLQG